MSNDSISYRELKEYLEVRGFFGIGSNKAFIKHQLQDPYLQEVSFEGMSREGLKVYLEKSLKRGGEWEEIRQHKQNETKRMESKFITAADSLEEEADGRITFWESQDGIELKLILHKPLEGQKALTENDVWKYLMKRGVTYGVKDEYIRRLIQYPVYERRFKLAAGEAPAVGEDGRAVFHFDQEYRPIPKISEDGTADYKSLNYAKSVQKGELLCEVIPPTRGKEGIGLDGKVLPGIMGKEVDIGAGMNTLYSPDKRKIYALCDGYPMMDHDTIQVCKVMRIDQVDNFTGNIDFIGTVHVYGDVSQGFKVVATDDIIVEGIVEGSLYAGRNIILRNGIKGAEREELKADGDIRTEFIENARVFSKGNIYADVILNSQVECWESMNVFGRRGKLVGGEYWVGSQIRADEIGNSSDTSTILRLFPSIAEIEKRDSYSDRIQTATQMLHTMTGLLKKIHDQESTEQQVIIVRIAYLMKYLDKKLKEWSEHLEKMQSFHARNRLVWTKEVLYPNVFIEMNGVTFRNTTERYGDTKLRVMRGKLELSSI